MLSPYDLVGFSDVPLEERAKPIPDDIQTLLSVKSAYVGLRKGFQKRFPNSRL
jgi:hypothetical protein